MKYPQAYVFFKKTFSIDKSTQFEQAGKNVEMYSPKFSKHPTPAVEQRAKVARSILEMDRNHVDRGNYVVFSLSEFHSFFVMNCSTNIEGIVWMASAADFVRLRSGLTAFKHYWRLMHGLHLTTHNYQHMSKILGQNCPQFKREDAVISALSSYMSTLEDSHTCDGIRSHLHSIARTGQYKV